LAPPVAGPRRSSILLALLIPVPGRLGGALGGPFTLTLLTERAIAEGPGGASVGISPPEGASSSPRVSGLGPFTVSDEDRIGGGPRSAEGDPATGVPLAVRGGPAFGGGGVAEGVGAVSPPFLLIHRLRSGS
jgi:hypothetical protein